MDSDMQLRFLLDQGFEFSFYESKVDPYVFEIGILVCQDDEAWDMLDRIYKVCSGIFEGIVKPKCITEAFSVSGSYDGLDELEQEVSFLNEIGLYVTITDKPSLIDALKPYMILRVTDPVFVSVEHFKGIYEYSNARTLIHSLYISFKKVQNGSGKAIQDDF